MNFSTCIPQNRGIKFFFILLTAILIAGCPMEESASDYYYLALLNYTFSSVNSPLNGTWVSSFGEIYTVNSGIFEYDDGWDGAMNFSGRIRDTVWFTSTFGVIIIEYIDKPIDFVTSLPTPGNFGGIYFRNLASDSVDFANATNLSDFTTASTANLRQAKLKFIEGSVGDFVYFWAICTRQLP